MRLTEGKPDLRPGVGASACVCQLSERPRRRARPRRCLYRMQVFGVQVTMISFNFLVQTKMGVKLDGHQQTSAQPHCGKYFIAQNFATRDCFSALCIKDV